jgi:hypothetical protein
MVQVIIIEKNGTVKQSNAKDLTRDKIYKTCGLKSELQTDRGFDKRTTWNVVVGGEKCTIELWAKDDGKAGTENKFELPEPVDKKLYFGKMAIVRINSNGDIIDIKMDLWNKIYDKLMGDFDDLEEEDEEDEEDELSSVAKSMKTKSGYLKDGFVVETNSDEDDEGGEEDDEDEDEDEDDDDEDDEDEDDEDLDLEEDCSEGSELDEESYDYSDEYE